LLDLASRKSTVQLLLEALATANAAHLHLHPETPLLYASGVSYAEEAEGEECWTDIPGALARGVGNCKDLVAWRLAELRVRAGELALPLVGARRLGADVKFHVVVRRGDGRIEDPSWELAVR
jgi:hypothetical protein